VAETLEDEASPQPGDLAIASGLRRQVHRCCRRSRRAKRRCSSSASASATARVDARGDRRDAARDARAHSPDRGRRAPEAPPRLTVADAANLP
jgi:hypothetical protein